VDSDSQDLRSGFETNPELSASLQELSEQYFRRIGYLPPRYVIDHTLLEGSNDKNTPPGGLEAVSPYGKALVRETTQSLIDTIEAIEPSELDFDPFVGEAKAAINVVSIRSVIQAEMFISSTVAEARIVQHAVAEMKDDREGARKLIEQRRLARNHVATQVRANYENAMRLHDELDDTDLDPLSPTNALRQHYLLDASVAQSQLELALVVDSLDDLNGQVEAFDGSWGGLFDAAHAKYAATVHKRRRRRRLGRIVTRLISGAVLAFVFLVLDLVVPHAYAFSGSALLATVAFVVDQRITRLADDGETRAKVRALTIALRESEELLVALLDREAQINQIRTLMELEPVRIVRRTSLKLPVF
jgi:hypothetical protein